MTYRMIIRPNLLNMLKPDWCPLRNLSGTSSDFNLDSFKMISAGLYNLGCIRAKEDQSSRNVYRHFKDPTSLDPSLSGNLPKVLGSPATSGHFQDFQQIHQITLNFGSPEVADQMSGNVYMHAAVVEDECSKCLRLADSISEFSINDLKAALTCLNWWGSDAQYSLALREVTRALDTAAVDRLNSLHFSLEDQLRLAFQWRSLPFQPVTQFPTKVLDVASPFVLQSSIPVLISFLWLLSTESKPCTEYQYVTGEEVTEILGHTRHLLGETEVIAACLGLRRLHGGEEGAAILASFLQEKFGYRI